MVTDCGVLVRFLKRLMWRRVSTFTRRDFTALINDAGTVLMFRSIEEVYTVEVESLYDRNLH